jgi:hypothetical protein
MSLLLELILPVLPCISFLYTPCTPLHFISLYSLYSPPFHFSILHVLPSISSLYSLYSPPFHFSILPSLYTLYKSVFYALYILILCLSLSIDPFISEFEGVHGLFVASGGRSSAKSACSDFICFLLLFFYGLFVASGGRSSPKSACSDFIAQTVVTS